MKRTLTRHKKNGINVLCGIHEVEKLVKDTKNCPICHCELNWYGGTKGRILMDTPSLDRKYNGGTMDIDNIIIMCYGCNMKKGILTFPELLKWIEVAYPNIKKFCTEMI